jgi:hypothetical protein
MNGLILGGLFLKKLLQKNGRKKFIATASAFLLTTAITIFLLGGFSTEVATASAGGFGYFNMNLNAFFNTGGWKYFFFNKLPSLSGQNEGFAYLGAGILFLTIWAVIEFFALERLSALKAGLTTLVPVFAVFMAALLFAMADKITFNGLTLCTIPLPKGLKEVLGTFRSSGRFSWICVYFIFIFAIREAAKLPRRYLAITCISVAIIIQGVDIYPVLKAKRANFNRVKQYNPKILKNPLWQEIAQDTNIKYIFMAEKFAKEDLYAIVNFSMKNQKTVNRFYIAHGSEKVFDTKFKELARPPRADTLYIFRAQAGKTPPYNLEYRRLGGYLLGLAP